jgi:hypothetical protein
MSKTSQRKEAERRKRLEKTHGTQGAKLMAKLAKYGPEVLESRYQVMAALSEMGPVIKPSPARKRLESLAHAFRPAVRALWQEMTGWDEFGVNDYALELPGFIAVWDKNDEFVGIAPARPAGAELIEAGLRGTVDWLFRNIDADGITEGDVVAWVVGGCDREDYATFCLWASRGASATAAHVLVDGKWIAARVPERMWLAGFMSAERSSAGFWTAPEVERLIAGQPSADECEKAASEDDRRRWVAEAVAREQAPHLEMWWRLLLSYQEAREEADIAWASGDEDVERASAETVEVEKGLVVHKDSVARVRQLLADLKVTLREVDRLRSTGQLVQAPAVEVAKKDLKTQLVPEVEADAVIERLAAFF